MGLRSLVVRKRRGRGSSSGDGRVFRVDRGIAGLYTRVINAVEYDHDRRRCRECMEERPRGSRRKLEPRERGEGRR